MTEKGCLSIHNYTFSLVFLYFSEQAKGTWHLPCWEICLCFPVPAKDIVSRNASRNILEASFKLSPLLLCTHCDSDIKMISHATMTPSSWAQSVVEGFLLCISLSVCYQWKSCYFALGTMQQCFSLCYTGQTFWINKVKCETFYAIFILLYICLSNGSWCLLRMFSSCIQRGSMAW